MMNGEGTIATQVTASLPMVGRTGCFEGVAVGVQAGGTTTEVVEPDGYQPSSTS